MEQTCSTPDCEDYDQDNYGEGAGCLGSDCDDTNPMIHWDAYLGTCSTGFSLGERDWNCNGLDDYGELGCTSPIALDVIGNGFEFTNANAGVFFDLNADGVKEKLSWTSAGADDAWLGLDRNGNGSLDTGLELFGTTTEQPTPSAGASRNGFLALAEFDKSEEGGNNDGLISKEDSIFSSLLLWQDGNHNGVSEPSELHTLKQLGLRTLHLDYKESKKTDQYGNLFSYRAKVKDSHDAQLGRWAWDVYLVRAPQ